MLRQLGMLRDKYADKLTEAAQLRNQLEQLTRALQVWGSGVPLRGCRWVPGVTVGLGPSSPWPPAPAGGARGPLPVPRVGCLLC